MDIIKTYLPEEMSEADMIEAVKKSIVNCEAKSSKDMGKVMADIKKNHGDNADMRHGKQNSQRTLISLIL
jgi:uncharacterized protein YqeY